MKEPKTYRVEITRSYTVSFLVADKSAMSAMAKAEAYVSKHEDAWGYTFDTTRRSAAIVQNEYKPVDFDLTPSNV